VFRNNLHLKFVHSYQDVINVDYIKTPQKMNKITCCLIFLLALSSCNPREIQHRPNTNIQKSEILNVANISNMQNFYDFKVRSLDGEEMDMAQFKGKKIVVLNVASECGYTPQYADWENFYKANKEKIVVVGFPCNQFGGQESGSNADIKSFCQKNYGVSFPISEKIDVKGSNKAPIYAWLTDKNANGWCDKEPSWNFCKYLINEKGELVEFFASSIKPDNEEFLKAIAK
jgi:glutathione peroxidase